MYIFKLTPIHNNECNKGYQLSIKQILLENKIICYIIFCGFTYSKNQRKYDDFAIRIITYEIHLMVEFQLILNDVKAV